MTVDNGGEMTVDYRWGEMTVDNGGEMTVTVTDGVR